MIFNRLIIYLCVTLISLSSAAAEPLRKPEGKLILVISGTIKNTNNANVAEFDRAMLEAIGLETVQTTSPWYEGSLRFEGVSLDKLMKHVGASGTKVTAIALNDYVTTIPLEDFTKFNVILAMKREGKEMAIRDKGPLFIIYPFDSDPQLHSQTYYTRSAWQVSKLIVE